MTQKYYYEPDDNSTFISQFLDTNGDGSGTDSATGDYSSTLTDFYIQPPAGEVYVIHSLTICITDGVGMDAGGYGALAVLPNGWDLLVTDSSDSTIVNLSGNVKVNSIDDIVSRYPDGYYLSIGNGEESYITRISFLEKYGRPLILKNQEKLKLNLNDDLTGLIDHSFFAKGFKGFGKAGNA